MSQLLAITKHREEKIKEVTSARLITIWECQFDKMVRDDPEMKEFVEKFDMPPPPIQVRQALYGGRTEPVQSYVEPPAGYELKYLDFCVSNFL